MMLFGILCYVLVYVMDVHVFVSALLILDIYTNMFNKATNALLCKYGK